MRLTDRQIRGVIDALQAEQGQVSGVALRAELARRYGARGGVSRIYRLLAEARGAARSEEAQAMAGRVRELEVALEAMRVRAETAEHREIAHQDRAAVEIHNLREKLRELQRVPRQQGVQHEQYLRAYREVIQLRQRVAQLERERTVSRYSE